MESKKKTRMSVNRKSEAIIRLLRGESLDELCREYDVSASELSEWRDLFIEGGKDSFRASPQDSRLRDAQQLIGQKAMKLELYKKKMELINQRKKHS